MHTGTLRLVDETDLRGGLIELIASAYFKVSLTPWLTVHAWGVESKSRMGPNRCKLARQNREDKS